ncbi:unnamed protein product [Acanthosepion pharaonis]|uniref:Uncharacterized protein n=1 Tax=Acanthosepion pharaonis TaxID=158019 RepID=A0A812BM54_ACAPH|nr:unnamed protein product [Sepia pharaonis]
MWNILLATEEAAKTLERIFLTTNILRLETEYTGTKKSRAVHIYHQRPFGGLLLGLRSRGWVVLYQVRYPTREHPKVDATKKIPCGRGEWTEVVNKGTKQTTPSPQQDVLGKVAVKPTQKQVKLQQQQQWTKQSRSSNNRRLSRSVSISIISDSKSCRNSSSSSSSSEGKMPSSRHNNNSIGMESSQSRNVSKANKTGAAAAAESGPGAPLEASITAAA